MAVESKSGNADPRPFVLQTTSHNEAQNSLSTLAGPEGEEKAEIPKHPRGSYGEHRRKLQTENENDNAAETRPLRLLISDRTALGCELMLLGLSRRRNLIDSVVCATSSTEVEQLVHTQQLDVALISAALSDG